MSSNNITTSSHFYFVWAMHFLFPREEILLPFIFLTNEWTGLQHVDFHKKFDVKNDCDKELNGWLCACKVDPHLEKVWPLCPGKFSLRTRRVGCWYPIGIEERIETILFSLTLIDLAFLCPFCVGERKNYKRNESLTGAHASNSIRHSWAFMERPLGSLRTSDFLHVAVGSLRARRPFRRMWSSTLRRSTRIFLIDSDAFFLSFLFPFWMF